jgi:hypothetical protein
MLGDGPKHRSRLLRPNACRIGGGPKFLLVRIEVRLILYLDNFCAAVAPPHQKMRRVSARPPFSPK